MSYPLTRIDTSGGSSTNKTYYDTGASPAGVALTTSVFVVNIGVYNVVVTDGLGHSQSVAPNTQQLVQLNGVGDGTTHVGPNFNAPSAGNPLNFYASEPSVVRGDTGAQLIPSGNQNFTGWTVTGGATVTVTQTGWNFLYGTDGPPSSPAPRSIDVEIEDAIGSVISPYNKVGQYQEWPGAEGWTWNVGIPSLDNATAPAWEAFLMRARGKNCVFQFGNPLRSAPQPDPATGTITLQIHPLAVACDNSNGQNLPLSKYLYLKGLATVAPGSPFGLPSPGSVLFSPGDYIRLGLRLHMILTKIVYTAGMDTQALEIWPSLREQPVDSSIPVFFVGGGGVSSLWRLAANKRKYSVDKSKRWALGFQVMEAR